MLKNLDISHTSLTAEELVQLSECLTLIPDKLEYLNIGYNKVEMETIGWNGRLECTKVVK